MSLAKVIFFALFGAFAFGITVGFIGWTVMTIARLLTVKAPRVRKAFFELTETTGNKNQDALIALVVFLPIWLPSAIIAYRGVHVNPSLDEKVGSILGIVAVMAMFLNKVIYNQKP